MKFHVGKKRGYVLAGVKNDYLNLLQKFSQTGGVRFEQFTEIWRDMKMTFIMAGRQNERDIREFTEDCLRIGAEFLLPPYDFQTRVGALYLLYGIYFKQVNDPTVKIRLTRENWVEIQDMLTTVQEQQHYDVEYIFNKLRYVKAFHFVATSSEVDLRPFMQEFGKNELYGLTSSRLGRASVMPKIWNSEKIDHLSAFHEKYMQLKCALAGDDATEPDPSLNVIKDDLVQQVTKAVTAHEDWRKHGKKKSKVDRKGRESAATTSESEVDSDVEQDQDVLDPPFLPRTSPKKKQPSVAQRRAEIRARAFTHQPDLTKARRHRPVKHSSDTEGSSSSPSKKKRGKKSRDKSGGSSSEEVKPGPSNISTDTEIHVILHMPVLAEETQQTDTPKKGSQKRKGSSPQKRSGPPAAKKPKGRPVKKQSKPSTSKETKSKPPSARKRKPPREKS